MGVGLVESDPDLVVSLIRNQLVVRGRIRLGHERREIRNGRKIDLAPIALVPVLVADISYGQYGFLPQRLLHAKAVLGAGGQLVISPAQARDGGRDNRQCWERHAGRSLGLWIRQKNVVEGDAGAERNVRAGVVHVVALNAFVHQAKSAADYGLALAGDVIGKSNARTESGPVVVHQTLRDPIQTVDTHAVRIQRNRCQDGIGAGGQAGTAGVDGAIRVPNRQLGGIIQIGVEVRRAVIRFIGMRDSIPPHSKVQREFPVYTPVVLYVGGPGNVVPLAAVVNSGLLILLRISQQVIGKIDAGLRRARVAGERTVEIETALRGGEHVLLLLVERPTATHLELVSAPGAGNIIADLVIVV